MTFVWRAGALEDAIRAHIYSLYERYGSAMDRAWRTRVLVWTQQIFDNTPIDPRHCLQGSFPSGSKRSSKQAPLMTGHFLQNASPPTPVLDISAAFIPEERPRGRSVLIKPISTFVKANRHSPASRKSVIKLTIIVGLSTDDPSSDVIPSNGMLMSYQMTKDNWERLFSVRTMPPFIRLGVTCKFLSILQEIRSSWDSEHLSVVQNTLQH